MLDEFMPVLSALFVNSDWKPQIGVAKMDKRAKFWLPPKKELKSTRFYRERLEEGPIWGCTQLAFKDYAPMINQKYCKVCWFGLDIDWDDNEHIKDLPAACMVWGLFNGVSMIRTSCSGKGIHMIWILDVPILCSTDRAGAIVKYLAGNMAYKLKEEENVHTCQANRRMFWLVGGKNESLKITGVEYPAPSLDKIDLVVENHKSSGVLGRASDKIRCWINIFQKAKVLGSAVGAANQVYVGDAVKELRRHNEKVVTKSGCSGNGQVNGYIDITPSTISLWSYADGHTIWSYTDLSEVLK